MLFSDSQARRLLTNYLVLVLRRVTGGQGDGDVVLRFVQKAAATTLRTQPYFGTVRNCILLLINFI